MIKRILSQNSLYYTSQTSLGICLWGLFLVRHVDQFEMIQKRAVGFKSQRSCHLWPRDTSAELLQDRRQIRCKGQALAVGDTHFFLEESFDNSSANHSTFLCDKVCEAVEISGQLKMASNLTSIPGIIWYDVRCVASLRFFFFSFTFLHFYLRILASFYY